MRWLPLILVVACGSPVGREASLDLTLTDAGDAGPFYAGSCLLDANGGFFGVEQDAGFTGDPGAQSPDAATLPLNGTWRVLAPLCLAGVLAADAGEWTCAVSGNDHPAAWTGSIKSHRDPYGWVLDVWPQPPIWQYASQARVTFISDNEIHAIVTDGYWGFPNSVIFLCRTPP